MTTDACVQALRDAQDAMTQEPRLAAAEIERIKASLDKLIRDAERNDAIADAVQKLGKVRPER